ncbi:hypothetical protein CONCODRAFT_44745, partial [Conidiobolus coronatus NRRL 28638]
LDCSPNNRERELGLDRREIGYTRGTVDSNPWFMRLTDQPMPRSYHLIDYS